MAVSVFLYFTFHVFAFFLLLHALPTLSTLPKQDLPSSSSSSSSSSSTLEEVEDRHICEATSVSLCEDFYNSTRLPNIYGHYSQAEAEAALSKVWVGHQLQRGGFSTALYCVLYFPPCPEAPGEATTPLPCRTLCEAALDRSDGPDLPVSCHVLPTEKCYGRDDAGHVVFLRKSLKALPTHAPPDVIPKFAPVDIELGNDDGGSYEVEVVSMATSQIPSRRYDIVDLGDPAYFRGWADVQGTGSANDYCRVIGKARKRFISCNLAGTTGQGQGHKYVSLLGFDPGFTNTWFMRDMDGDGRDDYCRCTKTHHGSKVTCMKAGEKGFYGSSTEGGSQYTFDLPGTQGCRDRVVNPMFGE